MKNKLISSPFFCFIRSFIRKLAKDNVSSSAANAALFLIISLFPFAMLLLSLIEYIPINESGLSDFFETYLPSSVAGMLSSIFSEMKDKNLRAVVPITVITSLWSASRGFFAITDGLNSVCGASETRNNISVRISSVIYTVFFLFALIATLFLWTFGSFILEAVSSFLRFPWIISFLRWILGFLLLTGIFWLIYIFAPNRRTKALRELPGAVICAMGWIGFSFLFSFYFDNFSSYDYIYGSLTAVVLLMLWVYFCMYILLACAEINWFISRKYI
ncbi:MAG: YihY/virulence factor BrkB family protein [Ruminococcaceae bacterium]|nr:YihY/virulence factor BrkB family protein [Oscillospiraceae bacterium]